MEISENDKNANTFSGKEILKILLYTLFNIGIKYDFL